MNELFSEPFKRKKLVPQKLLDYGFVPDNKIWRYKTNILNDEFVLFVTVTASGNVDTDIVEIETNESYVLYKTNATGSFVGEVRNAVLSKLSDMAEKCFESSVFKSSQAQNLIDYVRKTYSNELEFLWQKFPENAVWRREDTGKWYGALLTVRKNKLGLGGDEKVEVIDLRTKPEKMPELLQDTRYFPGYHMNKKNWFTVILDDSVDTKELFALIDESFLLAVK